MDHSVNLTPATAARLPRYFRILRELLINNEMRISSAGLAARLGLTPSQVRQDLRGFGYLGSRGYGYSVKQLYTEISVALGAGEGYTAIVFCGGMLDPALVSGALFEGRGVSLLACFSDCPSHGSGVLPTCDAPAFCEANRVNIAAIAISDECCAQLEPLLRRLHVDGVWNLTSHTFDIPVPTVNLSLGDSLMELCFQLRNTH